MRTKTLCLAAALLFAPAALLAQDSTAAASPASGANARIDAALDAAMDAGIPLSLLERKVAEGKAKGVPMERIAVAVEHRLDALTEAHDALVKAGLKSTTEGELSVAADAVQAGVSQSALVTLTKEAPNQSRAVAIAVLTDLVATGHASDQALASVQAALAHGPEALANLSAESAGQAHGEAGVGANVTGGAGGAGVQVGAGAGARVDLGR
jgi:lambda repressor-like predicted transcriptional regulator